MLSLVEQKKNWNLRVFDSVADAFDLFADTQYRGDKGLAVNAALIAFMDMEPAQRQELVDLIKLAEGRGAAGTIREAIEAIKANAGPSIVARIPTGDGKRNIAAMTDPNSKTHRDKRTDKH